MLDSGFTATADHEYCTVDSVKISLINEVITIETLVAFDVEVKG